MKKNTLHLFCAFCCLISFGQSTVYLENFTDQIGKGAVGPGGNSPTIDIDGVDWSIDVSNASLTATTDYFNVVSVSGNALFEGRNLDNSAIWLSPIINISNFSDVGFTIDVSESNGTTGNNLETTDTVVIEYRLDGGPWIIASNNGLIIDDFSPTQSSQTGLSGSTLELRVTLTNNGGGERQRFDNVEVTGTSLCATFSLPFNEGFEGATFPPDCWATYRGSNNLGTQNDWTSTTSASNSGLQSAFVEYEVVDGGNSQDWLVTPAIDLGTARAQLRFFSQQQFALDYGTEYSIRVSQTSATDISSFDIVKTYNEFDIDNPFKEQTLDLGAYSGIVYIAVVMEQNDGDNWYLDDVSVVEVSSCTTPENGTDFTASYDGTNINLEWLLGTCYDEYLIVGKENGAVTSTPSGDGSAYIADSNLGEGTELNTDEFVVFKGIGTETSVSNVNFEDTYHFTLFTRKGSDWSSGIAVSITLDYCTVTGDTTYDTAITLVDIGDISNVSTKTTGYEDFTAMTTDIRRGETEDLTVNINTDGDFNVYGFAWIDWNRDGDFEDTGEAYDLGETVNNANGATSNSPLAITVPVDAALGTTRMRVVAQYYFQVPASNGPCDGSTDGEVEDYSVTVLPGITYTYNDGWSPSDPNGVSTLANPVVVEFGDAHINTDTDCESFIVNPGASTTVASGVTLNVADTFSLESTSTSYSSLILDGNILGTVQYKRHVNIAAGSGNTTTANDLISPPLSGETFGDFRAYNPNILSGTIGGQPAFLFGPFDTTTGAYVNYRPSDDSNVLTPGIGYRSGSTDNSTFTFTGTVETGTVSVPVTSEGASNWNLIGNPYPSYLSAEDLLTEIMDSDIIDDDAVGIYGYDGTAEDGWTIYNLATTTPSTLIAPGQGFFIDAEESETLSFTPEMRRVGNSDDFIIGRQAQPLSYLKLKLSDGDDQHFTDIYFNANANTDLDAGYDASVWNGVPARFSIHSYLVENDNGKAMALQALHSNDMSNVSIPLGVNVTTNTTVEFMIQESTLPNTINIYLEDRLTDSMILLNSDSYEVTLDTSEIGKGRFYLIIADQSLSLSESNFNDLKIYANSNPRRFYIHGVLGAGTKLKVYDLQGRLLHNETIRNQNLVTEIDATTYPNGVYIITINNGTNQKTQTVILR